MPENNVVRPPQQNLNSNYQYICVKSKIKVFVMLKLSPIDNNNNASAMTIVLQTFCSGELKTIFTTKKFSHMILTL